MLEIVYHLIFKNSQNLIIRVLAMLANDTDQTTSVVFKTKANNYK